MKAKPIWKTRATGGCASVLVGNGVVKIVTGDGMSEVQTLGENQQVAIVIVGEADENGGILKRKRKRGRPKKDKAVKQALANK